MVDQHPLGVGSSPWEARGGGLSVSTGHQGVDALVDHGLATVVARSSIVLGVPGDVWGGGAPGGLPHPDAVLGLLPTSQLLRNVIAASLAGTPPPGRW